MANELILIVEDNEKNRKLLRRVLERVGYRTVEVSVGLDTFDVVRQEAPALILMDYQLPDIDGIEVYKRLRADPTFPRMPIVAVTASAMPEDVVRMKEAGFDSIVTKPINVKELLETIELALKKAEGQKA